MSQQLAQSVLHIEVKLKKVDDAQHVRPDLVVEAVRDWLLANFSKLQLHQQLTEDNSMFDALEYSHVVQVINVADHSGPGVGHNQFDIYDTSNIHLDVQPYQSVDNPPELLTPQHQHEGKEEEEWPEARVTTLPNSALDGLWRSLHFEDDIPARLLRYLTKMMSLSRKPNLDLNLLNWNRLILLHGPPGSGKTTLCMALAQKLCIRLGSHFSEGRLVEISSQSLHSRWFGQSGKLVSRMFDEIHAIADQDEQMLVFVMIDEIESLTGSREKVTQGSESNEGLRVTNQILTGLDRLRSRSNVLVFATSNLLGAIDPAFLDRADIKQLVPAPGCGAVYEILRSTMNELIRCGAVFSTTMVMEMDKPGGGGHQSEDWMLVQRKLLPQLKELERYPEGRQLWSIALKCQASNLSGRTLRRLPFSAVALYIYTETCSLQEALDALDRAVEELHQKTPFSGMRI